LRAASIFSRRIWRRTSTVVRTYSFHSKPSLRRRQSTIVILPEILAADLWGYFGPERGGGRRAPAEFSCEGALIPCGAAVV
jgi:hypothetical protein